MDQAPSSSTSLDKTKPSQRRKFFVEDITLDDMKDVQLPPNPSKIHLLFEVAHIANLRFEQAFNDHNRNKTIAAAEEKTNYDPLEIKIRQRIIGLGGVDTRLVMKNKTVFHSDINQNNNRLSMPFGQIRDWQFLSRDEMKRLNADEAFDVKLIFNSLNLKDINTVTSCKFCKWKMPKSSGRVNSIFALKGGWYKEVVSRVGLQKGNVIDIWSFRVNGDICFALFIRT